MYGDFGVSFEYEEILNSLIECFNAKNARTFLRCFWLEYSEVITFSGTMRHMVYLEGNKNQVYTKAEREFISSVENVIVFEDFSKILSQKQVVGRVVITKLPSKEDSITEALKFMKIFDKAKGDFNIYVLVSDSFVYLGCTKLGSEISDCYLSYPITSEINWEEFENSMMYVDDDSFYSFYNNFMDVLESINDMYRHEIDFDDELEDEYEEDDGEISYLNHRLNYKRILEDDFGDRDDFSREVGYIKQDLSFITSNIINPLELLFEAEKAAIEAESDTYDDENSSINGAQTTLNDDYDSYRELLDDPEALIKAMQMKNKQGK